MLCDLRYLRTQCFILLLAFSSTPGWADTTGESVSESLPSATREIGQPPQEVGSAFAFKVKTPSEDINVGAMLAVEALWRSANVKAGVFTASVDSGSTYPSWVHPYDNFWMNPVTPYFFPRESVELPIRLFAAYQLPTGEIAGGCYDIPSSGWRQKWIDAGGQNGWQGRVCTPLALWTSRTGATPDKIEYGIYVRDHLFVRQVYEQWRSSGNLAFLIEMYPHCRRSLKYLEERRDTDKNGLIETTALLSDLVVNGDKDNFSTERSEDQVMLYGALLGFEQMANALGGGDDAKWAKDWAARLKPLINETFWRPEGRYIFGVDRVTKEPRLEYVTTTYTNGYAILYGVADGEQAAAICDFMAKQKFEVPGPYHIPPIKSEDNPQNPPGVYCNGGCGWGRGIMPSVTLACFKENRIDQGVDYLQRQAAAARAAGSFHEYWTWEEYAGKCTASGAPWYCETSSGYLDALLHGLFGLSSPEPGYHAVRLAPRFPRDWNDASLELRVPGGSRIDVSFSQDERGWHVTLNSTPAIPVEIVLPWDRDRKPQLAGSGFKSQPASATSACKQVAVSFATGSGEVIVSGETE